MNEIELTKKMEEIHKALTDDYLNEVELVMKKIGPAFIKYDTEQCINLCKKMLKFRGMVK